ncbi:hypothetical protein BKH43_06915, partial [Helicobacter sp. 13S00401-1]|uniref:cache domain-containing protein n=1 Tax=Helicobacter sp. 13S00401-1 TaxID=1905758 RepID=UPI000BD64EEC
MTNSVFSKRIGLKIALNIAGIIIIVVALLIFAVIMNIQKSMLKGAENIMASRATSIGNYINFQMRDAISLGIASASKIGMMLDANENISIDTLKQEAYSINSVSKTIAFSGIYLNLNGGDSISKDGIFIGSFQDTDRVSMLDKATVERIIMSSRPPELAFKSAKPVLGVPTLRNINGKNIYTISANFPIFKHGKVVGLIQQRLDLDFIQEALSHSVGDIIYEDVDRYMIDRSGVIIADTLGQYRGKNLSDINNTSEFKKEVIDNILDSKDVSTTLDFRGMKRALVSQTFIIPPFNIKWNALMAVPKNEVLKDLYSLVVFIVISSIIAIVVIIFLFYFYINKAFIKRVRNIQATLIDTFAVINHEKAINIPKLDTRSKDELGVISNVINIAMDKTKTSLSKDSEAVSEALNVAKTIEEGNLSVRILKLPSNPQLIELRDVLNNMLDVLELKIGSNMNEIERVFDSYLKLDFSTSVLDS